MKSLRSLVLALAATSLFTLSALAGDSAWLTDYTAALAKAKEAQRPVLLEFTGSDWCPPCIAMGKEVVEGAPFAEFAKERLVLVKLDFPRKKAIAPEQLAHNRKLQDQFKIEGYPTLILVDADGRELARKVGYMKGRAEEVLAWLKEKTPAQ